MAEISAIGHHVQGAAQLRQAPRVRRSLFASTLLDSASVARLTLIPTSSLTTTWLLKRVCALRIRVKDTTYQAVAAWMTTTATFTATRTRRR